MQLKKFNLKNFTLKIPNLCDIKLKMNTNRLRINRKMIIIGGCAATFLVTAIIVSSLLISKNRLISQASCDEEALRVKELIPISNLENEYLTKPLATSDFVNPWLFTDYSQSDIAEYVSMLKKAGYKNIILQNVATISGGSKNDARITSAWYDTNLVSDTTSLEIFNPTLLKNLIDALSDSDMGIYIGIALNNDWLNESFTNTAWKFNNAVLTNAIINDIYQQYGKYSCFKGWYLPYDIYPNKKGYDIHWVELINYTLNYVSKIEANGTSHPVLLSPYINDNETLTENDVYAFWKNMLNTSNFRTGDIICLQDGLGTTTKKAQTVYNYISETKKAIESHTTSVNLWISIENYRDISTSVKPADLVKYKLQLDICAKLTTTLCSYSYSHYYNPTRVDTQYNTNYLEYLTKKANTIKITNSTDKKTSKEDNTDTEYKIASASTSSSDYTSTATDGVCLEFENTTISTPTGGKIYKDKNNELAPIPAGFSVSSYENVIDEGLVIIDKYQNEYVWVPVRNGIQPTNYCYQSADKKSIYYTRTIQNEVLPNRVTADTLPFGVSSDLTQIEKYHGFYVGRYESSFNYNLGQPTCQIKYLKSNTSDLSFQWKYCNSNTYTGHIWNNISYSDAKTIAESMSTKYEYHNSIKTGLINGTMWDTIMRWIDTSYPLKNLSNNSVSWGNFTNTIAPANTLNYQLGILKASGSNPYWRLKNIYDLAGNLNEWTSETDGSKYVIRGRSFNQSGSYGGASYASSTVDDEYSNTGFRVVLYLD